MTPLPGPGRIALIASYAPSLTLFRGPLIRDLLAAGHQVLCAAPDFDPAARGQLADLGAETREIPLQRTGLDPLADLTTLRALTALFREWRPDVVTGYTPKAAIYSALAAARAGVPRIVPMVTGLGYVFIQGRGLRSALIRTVTLRLYRGALARAHAVIFHNEDDKRFLAERGILPEGIPLTVVAGSGVDLDAYPEQPLPPLNGPPAFLMIARLVRYKGVMEYCEAARMLKERGVAPRCLLVGPEETGPAGFSASELDAYKDCVTWLGPAGDVRPFFGQTHVYVLPSYGEGMPRTVLEALASGRPVITTDAHGCRDTVNEGENGYLVPVGDAAALAAAMSKFVESPDLIRPMARAGRALAEKRFDVARVNAAMIAALGLDAGRGA